MYDVFLQRETKQEYPDCGGIYSKTNVPVHRDDLLFHYGKAEIKNSVPISQEVQSAFNLLANNEEGFFSLCADPEKLDRDKLEKYLQAAPDKVSRNDPLVHMKEIVKRPILDLKEDEIKQPTSRVKKFTPRALEYLASHSEDWRSKSFVGVHPQRLRSLVREDKWETYENRLLYTLCKTLNTLINLHLRELRGVDNAYGEIQRYYEIVNDVDYNGMQREVNQLLVNYSSDQVDENRKILNKTIEFLKRLQLSIGAFWNAPLFRYLKKIPNIELDINQFITTNILMNNQHYLYLPKIQKEIVSSCSKKHSKQENLEEQRQLLGNEIKFVKRCIDNFAENSFWSFLNPTVNVNEIGIEIVCENKKLRFSFATSKPSEDYTSRITNIRSDDTTISILIFPREKPYLETDESCLKKLFSKHFSLEGSYSLLGISPQSIFSKLLLQRILFQWMWPMLISRYPVKISHRFIKELIPHGYIFEDCLFKQYDIQKFELAIKEKERNDRIKKNDLPNFRKDYEGAEKALVNANKLIDAVRQCPCCHHQYGILSENPTPQNFIIICNHCGNRWSKNKDSIKWITADPNKLYGVFERFSLSIFKNH